MNSQLDYSTLERLGATGEQMAEYIGVSYRTYQRRAKKGMLDTVKGYERVKNKLVQIEYGTF